MLPSCLYKAVMDCRDYVAVCWHQFNDALLLFILLASINLLVSGHDADEVAGCKNSAKVELRDPVYHINWN